MELGRNIPYNPSQMILPLAGFTKLVGPDLTVLLFALLVLFGIPAAIAIPIIFIGSRRSKKRPPLPLGR
jgi:hypothetical protein